MKRSFTKASLAQWSVEMKRPLTRITLALLLVIALVLSVIGLNGKVSSAAWAAMVDALQGIDSSKYKFSVEMPDSKPSVLPRMPRSMRLPSVKSDGPGAIRRPLGRRPAETRRRPPAMAVS